jgi:hypothetical protein
MTENNFRTTIFNEQELLYLPINEPSITHKDILARDLFLYIVSNPRFENRDKIVSVISSGSFCYALAIESIRKYNSEFEIRVLIDYRNTVLQSGLKMDGLATFLTDLEKPLKSVDILALTSNNDGFDATNIRQYEDFNPYSKVALTFKKTLKQSRCEIKNIFVPFGSGNLHQALQNLNLSGITIWGCIPSNPNSEANKLTAKFRPFSNLKDVLEFDEDNLNEAIHNLGSLDLEPSALAGFATYNQYRSQMDLRSNETLIITTGNSINYSEDLRKARLKLEIDKR